MNQEEACLEVEGVREEIDDEFALDARDECFEESEEKKVNEDTKSEEDVEIEEIKKK